MKKLLSLAIIALSMTIHARAWDTSLVQKSVGQVTQSVSQARDAIVDAVDIPDSASLTFSKVYTDVKTGIAALASSLKVGAEHVYYILVKQQVVHAFTHIAVIIILLIASIIGYREARKAYKGHRELGIQSIGQDNMRNWSTDSSSKGVLAVALTILTIFIAFCCIIETSMNLDTIMMGLINPEYGAIKDIISIVK